MIGREIPHDTQRFDVAVIGGGIGGVSAARYLIEHRPGLRIALFEKEPLLAQGASRADHNTGVAHTGAFYSVDSRKAKAASEGFSFLRHYHEIKGLTRRDVGKIIAGTVPSDNALLERYERQALGNGQRRESVRRVTGDELRELEPLISPNVRTGLLLEDAYVFDAGGVIKCMEDDLVHAGVYIEKGDGVNAIETVSEGWLIETGTQQCITQHIVNCAGTHADKIARMTGGASDWKIIPVLGAYVRHESDLILSRLLYEPTRHPPFLGVHIMPGTDRELILGPDVFFSAYRERVGQETVHTRDLIATICDPFGNLLGLNTSGGPTRLFPNAAFYMGMLGTSEGRAEITKHFSMKALAADAQRLIDPEKLTIDPSKLTNVRSGIRAQALDLGTGAILNDMEKEIVLHPNNLSCLAIHDKMPGSPGFTASVGKARWLVKEILESTN